MAKKKAEVENPVVEEQKDTVVETPVVEEQKKVETPKKPKKKKAVVLCDRLNLREGPSTNYAVLKIALKDESYSLEQEISDWCLISDKEGKSYYAMKQFLSIK